MFSYSRAARATNVDVIAAVTTAMNATPSSKTMEPMTRPTTVCGTTSPYPTVVTVCRAHHMPIQMFGKSFRSTNEIAIPDTTTIAAVVLTITAAADRTVGGLSRKRDIRFSRKFSNGFRTFTPGTVCLHAHGVVAAVDVERRRGHVLRVVAQQIGGSRGHVVRVDVPPQ